MESADSVPSSDRLTDRISIGVLSAVITADLIDDVLVETRAMQQRTRLLPARVVVYFVLSLSLFYGDAYEEVMRKLVQGLQYLRAWRSEWQVPTASALCQARRRLGEEPLRELFHRVAVPIAERGTPGAWLGQFRLMAIDGVRMDVPDTPDNDEAFGRARNGKGWGPFPQVRVVGLGECGTHAIVAASIGATPDGERELAEQLFAVFEPGMLILADRGFYGMKFFNDAAATGADLLWRVSSTLTLPVLEIYPDGSYRSIVQSLLEHRRDRRSISRGLSAELVGTSVRVIEYTVDAGNDGTADVIRLITTIANPDQAPGIDLAAAYAERWEFEISLGEMETAQRGPQRVLRSQSPEMVRQEVWALLTTHYAIRKLMSRAAASEALDPDRLSFTRALRIIRRQITSQADFSP
jgi:Insertion element 4 transposase N-terminal/Transposase DDE domain